MRILDDNCSFAEPVNKSKKGFKETVIRFLNSYNVYNLVKDDGGMFYAVKGQPSLGNPIGLNALPTTDKFDESEIEKIGKEQPVKSYNSLTLYFLEKDKRVNSFIKTSPDIDPLSENFDINAPEWIQFCRIPNKYIEDAEVKFFDELDKALGF